MTYYLVVSDQHGHFTRYQAKMLFRDREGVMMQVITPEGSIRRRVGHDLKGWFSVGGRHRAPDFWVESHGD